MRSPFFAVALLAGFVAPLFPSVSVPARPLSMGTPSVRTEAPATPSQGVEPQATPRGKASSKAASAPQTPKKPPSRAKACKGVDEGYRALVQGGPAIVRSFTWCPGDVSPETAGYRAYQAEIARGDK